jgi:hypothetical protein
MSTSGVRPPGSDTSHHTPTVSAGIAQQLNDYCRYTRSTFVGLVHGYGNSRGDVARDPHDTS